MTRASFIRCLRFVLLLGTAVPCAFAANSELAKLNNEAVHLMNEGHLQEAKAKLEECLKKDGHYGFARENYAIVLNNIALKSPPKRAWTNFHQSYYINPNKTTISNMNSVLQAWGEKPSFQTHVKQAESAFKNDDVVTAVVEYEQALKLKDDAKIAKQLTVVKLALPEFWKTLRENEPALAASKSPFKKVAASSPDVDFGPYMADLQRRIKKNWFPPKGQESRRVVVLFKVKPNGSLGTDPRIDKSSGTKMADDAAIKAVRSAAPFRSLPKGVDFPVDIQFTFDYNVYKNSRTASNRGTTNGGTRPTTADFDSDANKVAGQDANKVATAIHPPPALRHRHGKSKGD